jgi:hypothetical protein
LLLHLALIGRLLGNGSGSVLLHVAHQIVLLGKALAAGATDKTLIGLVTSLVTHQVSLAHEVFAADITTERPLLLVRPLVEEQVAL